MLLVASETGHVYAYATSKLKAMILSEPGKQLIQGCLNTPEGGGRGGGKGLKNSYFYLEEKDEGKDFCVLSFQSEKIKKTKRKNEAPPPPHFPSASTHTKHSTPTPSPPPLPLLSLSFFGCFVASKETNGERGGAWERKGKEGERDRERGNAQRQ